MPAPCLRPLVTRLEDRLTPSNSTLVAVGADAGAVPRVQVYRVSGEQPELVADFLTFEGSFRGGVRVAVGDVDGDRVADLTVAAGPGGGPRVRVFRGLPGADVGDDAAGFDVANPLADFFAYDPGFTGGVNVAVAPVFFAVAVPAYVGAPIPPVTTGYVVTAPGEGGGPHVKVYEYRSAGDYLVPGDDSRIREIVHSPAGISEKPGVEFFAYGPEFRGGVSVAAIGNTLPIPRLTEADELPERLRVVTGAGPGGGPHVRVFDVDVPRLSPVTPGAGFFAYDPSFRGGVGVGIQARVSGSDTGPTGTRVSGVDLVTTAGPGGPASPRIFDPAGQPLGDLVTLPADTPTAVRATPVYPAVRNTLPPDGVYLQVIIELDPFLAVGTGGDRPRLRLFDTFVKGFTDDGPLPSSREVAAIDLPDDFRGGVNVG